jgi:exonuclease III
MSKRGVGILIKKNLNFSVSGSRADPDDNYLLLDLLVKGKRIIVGSIYGPNVNNRQFFVNLENDIRSFGTENIIIAGDWNCTISTDEIETNIDCVNMARPPNRMHSLLLGDMCERLNLIDPFRALYPEKIDYTYIPRAAGARNRSRIDYFLINQNLVSRDMDCIIEKNLQNKLFDHRAVILKFVPQIRVGPNRQVVDSRFLKDDVIELIIFSACAEAYAIHAARDALPVPVQRDTLQTIGRLKQLLKDIGPPVVPYEELLNDNGENFLNRRQVLLREAELCKDDIDLLHLQTINMDPDPDIFFETLVGMIKNELISYQTYAKKRINEQGKDLRLSIDNLKSHGLAAEFDRIFALESKLNEMEDLNMKAELEKFSFFDILNAEKITPYFLKVLKAGHGNESLNAVKNDDGTEFLDDKSRNEFITRFYKNLYSKDMNLPVLENTVIEDFLGPEICNNSIVKNSKLTEAEKININEPFSVEELDQSVEDIKVATAGGPDGIGNACVKKMWPFIRIPLTEYANFCLNRGSLTDNFRTAIIKLIPKKGDVSRIANWRPISLLNCLYKVVSRAINSRLKKISNRVLSRAQKGFTSGKYIQECLINIIETIKRCNDFNIPAFVLALDQAKAFDSVRHDFMRKCFEFFEFPEQFIRMLEVFTTNRTASIMLEGGTESKKFDLEIGNAQGNGPSPLQFNICEQILFFKIELDPRIVSVYTAIERIPVCLRAQPVTNFTENERDNLFYESNRETDKLEGFADDGTVIARATPDAIAGIREILFSFEAISGLKCNVNKSVILPIGMGREPVPDFLINGGFPVVENVTILGVKITNNFFDLTNNFADRIESIRKIRNFWSRLRLSLPGRLAVAKTFMLSQLGYLGSLIRPTREQMGTISELIGSYVKGNLNVSKERIFLKEEDGGLGMINLDFFITALQASWLKKIAGDISDNWRRVLHEASGGNLMVTSRAGLADFNAPISSEIADSFCAVRRAFCTLGNNLVGDYLLFNPLLVDTGNRASPFNILNNNPVRITLETMAVLKIEDLWNTGTGMRRLDEICDNTGINISLVTYMRLGQSLTPLCRRITNDPPAEKLSKLFTGNKKGSKQIRNVLYKAKKIGTVIGQTRQVQTFFRLLSIPVPDNDSIVFYTSMWKHYFLPNKMREFAFKFCNNLLGINTRVAHFNNNINVDCTFCRGGGQGGPSASASG